MFTIYELCMVMLCYVMLLVICDLFTCFSSFIRVQQKRSTHRTMPTPAVRLQNTWKRVISSTYGSAYKGFTYKESAQTGCSLQRLPKTSQHDIVTNLKEASGYFRLSPFSLNSGGYLQPRDIADRVLAVSPFKIGSTQAPSSCFYHLWPLSTTLDGLP